MKFRAGFVSNSSSSSFIICLPRRPKTVEELQSWLFPDGEKAVQGYGDVYSTLQIARRVFLDISGDALAMSEMTEKLSRGTLVKGMFSDVKIPEYPMMLWDKTKEERTAAYAKYDDDMQRAATEIAERFMSQNEGSIFFAVNYADDCGDFESTMEHGHVFRHIPHQQISHH
jgi:hypothetical protein